MLERHWRGGTRRGERAVSIRYRMGESSVLLSSEQWDEVGVLVRGGMLMRKAVAQVLCWNEPDSAAPEGEKP